LHKFAGGSAGAVVANRLTENPKVSVLLLEAGPDENEVTDVPSFSAYLQLSNFDYSYKTEPQSRACLGMVNNRCNWPRGKVLGGSSVLNYMIYVRGNKNDFDHWGNLGNTGWDYKSVLPYFLKSEDNRNPYLARSPYHATGGYLTVQEAPWHTPLVAAFVEAGTELGYENRDINGERQSGYMIAQGTIRRGSRCSTAKAFIRPIRLRPNFHLALNAFVTKIEIDPHTKRAWGVEFVRHNRKQVIRARREVILSAGAINSPQILMLSGIGPRDHLQAMNIPVIQDLPVGNNLMDHLGFGGLTFIVDKPVAILQNRLQAAAATTAYVLNESGKCN
jgi:choline dehydrogenase-like flavoprotein